jgi:cell division protein FtsQ
LQGYELMTLEGGVPVRIGFEDVEPKLARLERIYAEIESRLPVTQYIDLNAADRVIVKLDPIVTQSKQEKVKS